MFRRKPSSGAVELGAVSRPKRITASKFLFLQPWPLLWSCILFFAVLACQLPAQTIPADLNIAGAEFDTYAHGSAQEITDCKVDRIFTDHRRLGFFHVQLLPLVVAQGVHLELAGQKADGGWVDGFKSDWLSEIRHGALEWRDVSVLVKADGAPTIHADRVIPAPKDAPVVCKFENVTLKARGKTWQTGRAELRNEDGRPRVVWRTGRDEHHWDLFTGEMADQSTQTKTEK